VQGALAISFESNKNISYKTLITQEMLKVGILASNAVYVCTEHSSAILDKYFFELDKVFSLIKECEEGRDIKSLLESEECSQGFRRLN